MGCTKLVWNENGHRIRIPDPESYSNPFVPTPITNDTYTSTTIKEFKYEKTLDQVLSSTDRFHFDRLKTDEALCICENMITGLTKTNPL
jgi:hypothetical protein